MFFSPFRAILWDEYLTSAVRTNEGDKAGSNQQLAHEQVHFKMELGPKYLISFLKNTGCHAMPAPSESSILPKSLEKNDPEVARPATWSVQNSRPKAFEVCASIQSTNQRIATVVSSKPQPCPAHLNILLIQTMSTVMQLFKGFIF